MLQMTWQPSLLKSLKRKHGAPPLGLRNLGNTCYLNSVLQCLTYTPPLANFCIRFLHSSNCDSATGKEKKGDCPFCLLEKRIVRSLSSEAVSDAPLKINSCLRIYAEHFRNGRQEDAHEFLRYVIDACHNTCVRLKKLQKQQRGRNGITNGGDTGGIEETVVKEIFGGALQSQVKCLSCGSESNKVDEIMDISLDILNSGSLSEALQKFFQPEVLDGNNKYKCDNCKSLVTARKQMSVLQAPNVLVVQLKRFEGMFGGKVDKLIAFDETLVLSGHVSKGSQDLHPEYNLFGAIIHSGYSPDSGHYYAYIKDAIGRWYCCNDSCVSVSTLQEVLSEKAYILFFSRIKPRPRTRVDVVANGSKPHESNGSKMTTEKKLGCMEKPISTAQVSNYQPETNTSTNGTRLSSSKSGGLEKPVSMRFSASRPKTNNSINYLASNGTGTPTMQKYGSRETPSGIKEIPHNNSTGGNNSVTSVESLGMKSDNCSQNGNSTKYKIDTGHSNQHDSSTTEELVANSSTAKVLPAPANLSVNKNEHREENGNPEASVISLAKEKTGSASDVMNDNSKMFSSAENIKNEISSMGNHGGVRGPITENGHSVTNSLGGNLPKENGSKVATATGNGINCQDAQNADIRGASKDSGMKRKIKDNQSSIFLATDNLSRAKVEAFKESIGKEASAMLRSCGWSDEVYSFMHARKKFCQESGNTESNYDERKGSLITLAKKNFISKVPEKLKAALVERLRSFNQEEHSFGT